MERNQGDEMRLIVASVQDYDAPALLRDLTGHGWRATQIASTGKALRSGQSTVFVGVPRAQVGRVVRVIDQHCRTTIETVNADLNQDEDVLNAPITLNAKTGGALVSVLKVVRFERL